MSDVMYYVKGYMHVTVPIIFLSHVTYDIIGVMCDMLGVTCDMLFKSFMFIIHGETGDIRVVQIGHEICHSSH